MIACGMDECSEHEVLASLSADIEAVRRDIEASVLRALLDPMTGMQEGACGADWLLRQMLDTAERHDLVMKTETS